MPGLLRRAYSSYFAHSEEKASGFSTRFLVATLVFETERLLLRIRIGLNSKASYEKHSSTLIERIIHFDSLFFDESSFAYTSPCRPIPPANRDQAAPYPCLARGIHHMG